ncbi:hypothetical protein ACLOJK_011710 [Asimina triloba]
MEGCSHCTRIPPMLIELGSEHFYWQTWLHDKLPYFICHLSYIPSNRDAEHVHQMSLHFAPRALVTPRKYIEDRCTIEDRVSFGMPNGVHTSEATFKTQATKALYTNSVERSGQSGIGSVNNMPVYGDQSDNIMDGFLDEEFYRESQKRIDSIQSINESNPSLSVEVDQILDGQTMTGSSASSSVELQFAPPVNMDEPPRLPDELNPSTVLSESAASEQLSTANTTSNISLETPTSISDTVDATNDAFAKLKQSVDHLISGANESVDASVDGVQNTFRNTYDAISASLSNGLKSMTESFENATGGVASSIDNTSEVASNQFSAVTSALKESSYRAGTVAVDVLRWAILAVGDSLANAGSYVVYSYGSAKALLPSEVQDVVSLSEEKVVTVLAPVETAFHQVYVAIEGLEKYLGFDPNDPLVPFALFLGSATILGTSYWVFTYGGYSGDLSPKSTLELLSGQENVVIVDDLRERDGVPDLRRGARYKYASITLPEVDGSLRRQLKRGREVDDALVAVLIRNLKIVLDRSKVIVMDASGARSKGIARSLRKLGVKKPYQVQGGFRSWVKDGLRVKELKPETPLTVLNEEAEAILEDFRPTPLKIIGYGSIIETIHLMGQSASEVSHKVTGRSGPWIVNISLFFVPAGLHCYSKLAIHEWEKTLQLIGLIGLALTIYLRFESYKDAEDFKQDLSGSFGVERTAYVDRLLT